jgi:hypothetical protein
MNRIDQVTEGTAPPTAGVSCKFAAAAWREPSARLFVSAAAVVRKGLIVSGEPPPAILKRQVRIVSMYATRWRNTGTDYAEKPDFELGVPTRYYPFYKDRLPRRLRRSLVDGVQFTGTAPQPDEKILAAEVSLFALPSGQIVCAVTLTVDAGPFSVETVKTGIARVLECCIEGDLRVGDKPLSDYVDDFAKVVSSDEPAQDEAGLLPERHLLVFIPRLGENEDPPGDAAIDEIVFLDIPPFREEFIRLQRPDQLNQSGRTLGAVTPYVSLLYGHEKFVEDSVFVSTVQALGAVSRFRQIWHTAYQEVQEFRLKYQREDVGVQKRDDLEKLADKLGNLEFDLTFSVEFPLIRIESFHSALFEALDLPTQTQSLSQMFAQLSGSLRSELTAIEIRERQRDLRQQKWNAAVASIISLLGVSIGFTVAFFGINGTQVNNESSIFNLDRYLWVYIFAIALALIPAILIFYPYVRRGGQDSSRMSQVPERKAMPLT